MTAPKPRLDVDATRERLRSLGCGYAAERLGDLLGEAVRAEIAPHAFLEQLLAAELSGREERRVKTSLKVSNLPLGQTLENFDFACPPGHRALPHRHARHLRLGARGRNGPAAGAA